MDTRHILGAMLGMLLFAPFGGAAPPATGRYLVDGRVRVDLFSGDDRQVGDLWWLDTVSGVSGDARFSQQGAKLVVEWSPSLVGEARLVPDVAIVFSGAPWTVGGQGTSLGLSLD